MDKFSPFFYLCPFSIFVAPPVAGMAMPQEPPPAQPMRPPTPPKPPVPPKPPTPPTAQRPTALSRDAMGTAQSPGRPAPPAQPAEPEQGGYDFALEKTYDAKVISFADPRIMPERAHSGSAPATLTVSHEGREYLVFIGTSDFLKANGSSFAPGDEITIKGTIRQGSGMRIAAREIKKGESTLTLIDANGSPLWQPKQQTGPW